MFVEDFVAGDEMQPVTKDKMVRIKNPKKTARFQGNII
jgi:hypothetical protein